MKHYLVCEFSDAVNKNKFAELGTNKGATTKDNILREIENWAGDSPLTAIKVIAANTFPPGDVLVTLPTRIGVTA